MLLDIGIEFEISYMMKHLHLVYDSLCAMLHCHTTLRIFYSNVEDKSGDVNISITVYLSFDAAYDTPADSSIPVTNKYDAQRYLKY